MPRIWTKYSGEAKQNLGGVIMSRQIDEMKIYTREQLENLVKTVARIEIIGNIYRGEIHNQTVSWNDNNGSITVVTSHTPEI